MHSIRLKYIRARNKLKKISKPNLSKKSNPKRMKSRNRRTLSSRLNYHWRPWTKIDHRLVFLKTKRKLWTRSTKQRMWARKLDRKLPKRCFHKQKDNQLKRIANNSTSLRISSRVQANRCSTSSRTSREYIRISKILKKSLSSKSYKNWRACKRMITAKFKFLSRFKWIRRATLKASKPFKTRSSKRRVNWRSSWLISLKLRQSSTKFLKRRNILIKAKNLSSLMSLKPHLTRLLTSHKRPAKMTSCN